MAEPKTTKPPEVLAKELRAAKKELRETRDKLKSLSNAALLYLKAMDETLAKPMETPEEVRARLKAVGKLASRLEFANDHVRFFALGVDFRNDKKEPAK
jgi:hypothetical protein